MNTEIEKIKNLLEKMKVADEAELASSADEANWMMCDCGHDCCPCNSQCK